MPLGRGFDSVRIVNVHGIWTLLASLELLQAPSRSRRPQSACNPCWCNFYILCPRRRNCLFVGVAGELAGLARELSVGAGRPVLSLIT